MEHNLDEMLNMTGSRGYPISRTAAASADVSYVLNCGFFASQACRFAVEGLVKEAFWDLFMLACVGRSWLEFLGVEDVEGVVRAEYDRAALKHPGHTFDESGVSVGDRVAALLEEVGEAASALTYDRGDAAGLVSEVVQIVNLALTWMRFLWVEERERITGAW